MRARLTERGSTTFPAAEPVDASCACSFGEPPVLGFGNQDIGLSAPVAVYEDFVAEAEREKLLAQLPDQSTLNGATEIKQLVGIPSTIHHQILKILSCASPTGFEALTPDEDHPESHDMVHVPAKMSRKAVALHKDKFCDKEIVDGLVAVVYLTNGGTMTLINHESGQVERVVEISAGRMIVWDNRLLMHKVDAGNSQVRVMLGNMTLLVVCVALCSKSKWPCSRTGP